MSLRQVSFRAELESELREAGLPTDPRQVIDCLYQFGCQYGSHHDVILGTVKSAEVSDQGGLDLYVSSPSFRDEQLVSIKHNNGKWMAHVDIEPRRWSNEKLELGALQRMPEGEYVRIVEENTGFFEGEFELL